MPSTESNASSGACVPSLAHTRNLRGTLALLLLAACNDTKTDTAPDASSCRIDAGAELSSAIPTVGIVTWSANVAALDAAHIEFGRDTSYGAVAPVKLDEPEHRTLLLGMTASTEYHFRVVASSGSTSCVSDDHTLTTGPLDNGLALPSVTTLSPDEVAPGFLIASQFESGGPGGPPGGIRTMPPNAGGEGGGPDGVMFGGEGGAPGGMLIGIGGGPAGTMLGNPDAETGESLLYILNAAGEVVWWRTVPLGEVTRVLMSYDASSMLAMSLNVAGTPSGRAVKVSMDGLDIESIDVPNAHHDFTITPDDALVFIRKGDDECDDIMRLSRDREWTRVFRVADAFGEKLGTGVGGERCHTNSIHYHATDDSFTFSVLNMNSYVKVSAGGELQWVLGGVASEFGGDGAEWDREHGHDLLSADRLLFFNNRDVGSGDEGSLAIEVELEHDTGIATRVWTYDGGLTSAVLGDVQRLPNGNTVIAYSTSGVIHQVNAAGTLVQELTWPIGGAFGYVNHRPTLYGPPDLP